MKRLLMYTFFEFGAVENSFCRSRITVILIGVTFAGYGGYVYPPLFGLGGTVPPTFQAHGRKITVTVPEHTLQTYQVSRISRETPAFWSHLPLTRRVIKISLISSTKFGQLKLLPPDVIF